MNEASDSSFVTRKSNIVNYQWKGNSSIGNKIIHSTEVLKSNVCDLSRAYVLVRASITVVSAPAIQVTFKNCVPGCITKIDRTKIQNDVDFFMLMCNFTEYNSNCFATTGSLSFYSKGEATNFGNDIVNTDDFKSFNINLNYWEIKLNNLIQITQT